MKNTLQSKTLSFMGLAASLITPQETLPMFGGVKKCMGAKSVRARKRRKARSVLIKASRKANR